MTTCQQKALFVGPDDVLIRSKGSLKLILKIRFVIREIGEEIFISPF
jgi:hypothetical protein